MKRVYLDYNSTTPVEPAVVEAMNKILTEEFGNPSSVHGFGQKAKAIMEDARERVATAIGARPDEIFFTSGGTEADNIAVKGGAWARRKKGTHIITSQIEHHAVLESAHYLEKNGYEVTYLGCENDGRVSVSELRDAIRDDTILVSVMMANNETGMVQPIKEMAALCRERQIPFHTDAVQAIGKIPVDVNELGVDMLSLSGHKIYGPKGIGALYIRKGVRVTPLLHGGSHERRKRAGTENMQGIVGIATAIDIVTSRLTEEQARMKELSDFFIKEVQSRVKDVFLNGTYENRIPSTVNLSFKGVEGEAIILSLDMKGIGVSSGSACTSGSLEPSHVLLAMKVDDLLAQGSIRFSMGHFTTKEDLQYTADQLPEIIDRLRAMSAAYN